MIVQIRTSKYLLLFVLVSILVAAEEQSPDLCTSDGCLPDSLDCVISGCNPGWECNSGTGNCFEIECTSNWQCSNWQPCTLVRMQDRICDDLNSCATTKERPDEVQTCIPAEQSSGQYIVSRLNIRSQMNYENFNEKVNEAMGWRLKVYSRDEEINDLQEEINQLLQELNNQTDELDKKQDEINALNEEIETLQQDSLQATQELAILNSTNENLTQQLKTYSCPEQQKSWFSWFFGG